MITPSTATRSLGSLRALVVLGMLVSMLMPLGIGRPAYAANVFSAIFTPLSGPAIVVNGTLFARSGAQLLLTVNTSPDTRCVQLFSNLTGLYSPNPRTSAQPQTIWYFNFAVGGGNGGQFVVAAAFPGVSPQNTCSGTPQNQVAAFFVLDNAGPVVTAALVPTPNAAGWNTSDVTINWSATDTGSGVASGPTPATDSQQQNTAGVIKTATAIDRLGNGATGSVMVKLDKNAPTITGSRSPAANGNGWNNTDVTVSFSCSDSPSGIKSCSAPTTLSSSAANQYVTGTAVDNADNSASATVSGINIDTVAPTLTDAPTTSPNAAGWYNGNVTIHWTANDALSGVDGTAPADSTISSEGSGRTASASVSDNAGNTTNAVSSPVNIDKTTPNTTASAPPAWNNTDVTVNLNASDALSGVAATYYTLDGGAQQSGMSVPISADGIHTLQFWSVDNAGNAETARSVQVKIDRTPPTINHTQSPAANANGWNNTDVTVTFTCGDSLSGVAGCNGTVNPTPGSPSQQASVQVTSEGADQAVTGSGTAVDVAGNTSTRDPAAVSIDETPPTISAAADRPANANGWYNADVTVSFACADALSGVAGCPSAQMLGEGPNQSASGTATDAAGNSASAGVTGINVDKTAPPLTGAATTAPNANGWYNGDVTVHWTAADALSGLDGSAPADSTLTGEGDSLSASASVSDLAGNTTSTTVSGIKIDRSAPTTSASVPAPLTSGWYAGPVQVTLTGVDGLSGVDTTYYSVDGGAAQVYAGPFSDSLPGSHTITFWSVDRAGNVEDNTAAGNTITLKIDNLPPAIAGSAAPAPNASGWNNSPVTVSFNCSDAESGIASCSDPVTLSTEGAGQSATGTATDLAGNTASTTVSGINIDLTGPTLSPVVSPNPVTLGASAAVTANATDSLSGVASSSCAAVDTSSVGTHTVSCTATDNAGNTSTVAASYDVNYNFSGFASPINGDGSSVFKAGSTVPVKFRIGDVNGYFTSAISPLPTFSYAMGGTLTGDINEQVYSDPASTGNAFRWDSTAQQYIYNWRTTGVTAGRYYQVCATLGEASPRCVTLGLR